MNKYQLVVLDMAGTTVHDKGNVGKAFINAFQQHGLQVELSEVKKVMGYRKKDAVRILMEKFHPQILTDNNHIIDKIHEAFIAGMINFYTTDPELKPLPHAEKLFQQLKQQGLKVALNTGFTKAITNTILKRLYWAAGKNFDMIISSDEVENGRPHADMIRSIMQKLNISDPAQVVKVGDTEVDVQEGRTAGCGLVVSVTTGAYSRQQLETYKPDYIIDSLAELPPLILS